MFGSSFEVGIKKVEKSTPTVIRTEMNDEFRMCGVDHPDGRTTEGPWKCFWQRHHCHHTGSPQFTHMASPDKEL